MQEITCRALNVHCEIYASVLMSACKRQQISVSTGLSSAGIVAVEAARCSMSLLWDIFEDINFRCFADQHETAKYVTSNVTNDPYRIECNST